MTAALAVLTAAGLGVTPLDAADPPAPTPADTGLDRIIITGGNDERVQETNPGTGTRSYRLGPATVDDQGHAGYARIFSPPLLEYIPPAEFAQSVGTTNAPDTLSDRPPRAERSHVFDAGASWAPLAGLTLGLDGYYKRVRNMQDEEGLGASLIFTPFTYARGYKEGIECTADFRRGPWLLYGNAVLAETKGRDINSARGLFDEDELREVDRHDIHTDYDQRWTASAGAAYQQNNLTLHADLLFGSGFYGGTDNENQLPAHCTVNVGVIYTASLGRRASLTLRLDVINLFDQSYLLHDAGIGATVNQFGERRGFFGGTRLNF